MRILVCGGRDFDDRTLLFETLDPLYWERNMQMLIHGGAKGADRLSVWWAEAYDIDIKKYPADWNKYGKAAGPIRNQQMIDEGKPDLVVAFPGGRGTADMVKRARKAGIEVREIKSGGG